MPVCPKGRAARPRCPLYRPTRQAQLQPVRLPFPPPRTNRQRRSTRPTPSPADAQTPLPSPYPVVAHSDAVVLSCRQAHGYAAADMDLRSGPGIDFPIVEPAQRTRAAAAGNTFRITGRHPAGEWWQIEVAAGPAWVYALFVQVEGPIESLGYTAVLPPPPPPVSTSTPFPTPSSRCPGDCAEAHERGLSNMTRGHLCYRPELDSDGNGIACERNR